MIVVLILHFLINPYIALIINVSLFKEDDLVLVTSPQNNIYVDGITNNEIRRLSMIYTDFFSLDLNFWFYSLFPENHRFKYKVINASRAIDTLVSGVGYSFLPSSYIEKELKKVH